MPHNSSFNVKYNAEVVRWFGTLTIETPAGPLEFSEEAPGVFGILINLDRKYRKWLKAERAMNDVVAEAN